MPNIESQNSPAVNFLGAVMQEQPEILDSISPREGYILFSHVDPANPRSSYKDLGNKLGMSSARVGQLFHKTLTTVYERAPLPIQEDFDLSIIFEAAAGKNKSKIGRKTKEKLDLVKGLSNWDPIAFTENSSLEMVDPEDQSLWNYALENGLLAIIRDKALMTPEELALLSRSLEEGKVTRRVERILNKFSILVANIA